MQFALYTTEALKRLKYAVVVISNKRQGVLYTHTKNLLVKQRWEKLAQISMGRELAQCTNELTFVDSEHSSQGQKIYRTAGGLCE